MAFRPKGSKTVDPILGSRLLNAFWLAASLGGAMLQFRLLAQALALVRADGAGHFQGTLIACFCIAWLSGKLVSRTVFRQAGRVAWGISLLVTASAWLLTTSSTFALWFHSTASAFSLGALAFLLALFSFAWMSQERPWPKLRSATWLTASLVRVLVGLCSAWLLPAWSGSIGVVLLLPLLSLDLWAPARCPLPEPRGLRTTPASVWMENTTLGNATPTVRDSKQPKPAGWWWFWLASNGLLSFTLLASATEVILTSAWLVVPTLYASSLAQEQGLDILLWLLGGQLGALLLARGVLLTRTGTSLLAPVMHTLPRRSGWGMLLLAGICLGLLGNPWFHATWLLVLAIMGYTLALEGWLRLSPRLVRGKTPGAHKGRQLVFWLLPDSGDAPNLTVIRTAHSELARRCVARWEWAFLLGMTLLVGSLCDLWDVNPVLLLTGCALMGCVALAMLCARYCEEPADSQDQSSQGPPYREGEFQEPGSLRFVGHRTTSVHVNHLESGDGTQEPLTGAQLPISLTDISEHHSSQIAAQFTPFQGNGENDGGFNSSAIH